MNKKLLLSSCFALVLAACQSAEQSITNTVEEVVTPSGISHVETVRPKDDDIIIPYKKYTLDNGLTLVLHQDKSDPLVHVDVTYHVGSGREDVGKSGFAHFFEHMMFQGSENVADEQHFALITESGGTLNGTTNSDRTNYFETVPSNQLEKMLWLEADRMGYFLNAVTEEKFENQRETVKNERGQRVDNRPYGLLFERVGEAQFPKGHPYSWSTIGYIEDLNRATLDDLKKFFLRWYGPNNATLTIGGDFDEAQTLEWVKKYFGSIPTGPAVEKPEYVPVTLDENRYISLEDNVQLPLLYLSWPTVHVNHPDEAPLDVLMNIMGDGQTSLLYKNLDKPGLTVQSSAGHFCRELACSFTLFALANPAKVQKLSDLETIIRESLTEFENRGVQDDDITRVKASIVSGMIYGLESVSGKVSQLASYETFRNSPNGIGDDITRYENVSKADVMRVYNKYIKNKPAVIMSIVPKGAADAIAKPDTWQRYERTIPEAGPSEAFTWELPQDDFDRSVVPPSGANPSIKAPNVYRASLSNGVDILGAQNKETPTTTISLRIKTGQSHEPLDKLGLTSLTAGLLNDATVKRSVEDISNELAKMGSNYSWSAGDNYTTLSIRSLTKDLDKTIELAVDSLLNPRFDPQDFDRIRSNTFEGIKADKKEASVTANNVFNLVMYGKENSFAYSNNGTETSVQAITLDDIKAFYKIHYSPKIASIVAVSDLDEAALKSALKPFAQWEGDEVPEPQSAPYPDLGKTKVFFVNKDDAAQSEIRIGKRALPYDATGEYFRAGLMNYTLGGAFNSRINLNLREDKGYTYGARSGFNGLETRGVYRASAGVRADSTAASITEFIKEISGFHSDGITQEELAFTKSAIGQRDARAYETPSQKLGFLSRMMSYDLKPSFVDEQSSILQGMTKPDIDALAQKHLDLEDMVMVVVGDKAKHMEEVKALGYPVIELDPDGNPL